MSSGAVEGLLDQFGSIGFRERGGFREHSREDTEILFADLGYKFSLNFVSRHELFGQRNIFTIGLNPQVEDEHSQNYENLFRHTGATTARGEGILLNLPFFSKISSTLHRDSRSSLERRPFSQSGISLMISSARHKRINQIGRIFGDSLPSWA
jgi:hypothetical protein